MAYKERPAEVKARIKEMSRDGKAVLGSTNWQVNGSVAEGRRMVRDFSKLMLRAYNAEADNCVRTLRPYKLQSAVDRLGKAVEVIVKLGKTMSIHVSGDYHRLRVHELGLTADYLAKQEDRSHSHGREEGPRTRSVSEAGRKLPDALTAGTRGKREG
ncbi:DUF4041 domain-containing protein [Streptosporangium vulgare]|uniref:DUF4041 domain-containing protein n=1 Tax=Streptosporangium vulgare TaxID=46190 RepID=UPI0031D81AD4